MYSKRGGGRGRPSDGGCFYCHRTGHRKDECPELKAKGSGGRPQGSGPTCFTCGKAGHRNYECPESAAKGSGDGWGGSAPVCYNCGQSGHRKDQCRQESANKSRGQESADRSQAFYGASGGDGHYRLGQRASYERSGSGPAKKPFQPSSGGQSRVRSPRSVDPITAKELQCKARSQFVPRPDTGRKGKLMELIANHFRLVISDVVVYHYHIEISYDDLKPASSQASGGAQESKNKMRKLNQKENRLVFEALVNQNAEHFKDRTTGKPVKNAVFDGNSNIYTAMPLMSNHFETTFKVDLNGKDSSLKVVVKLTQKIDLSQINLFYDGLTNDVPRQAMQAIDIILRYGPTSNRVPIGNSLYPKWDQNNPESRIDIDFTGNKQVAFGHYQSMRLTKVGPTLLVDRSATAFYTGGSLLSYLSKLLQETEENVRLDPRNLSRIRRELKGLRIYTTHLPYKRPYTIKDISDESVAKQKFPFEKDGRSINITV